MSRPILLLIVILALLVGGMVFLSNNAKERPTTRVEKVVPLGNLQ